MRILTLLALTAAAAWPQVAQEANRDYGTAEGRAVMVQRLENPERLANLRPRELVARLKIAPGSTVVDLGTGTGALIPDLSAAVGSGGRVIAEDIQTDFLERARERVKTAGLSNVEFVLGTERDPKLPAGAADLVIVLDAYHHFDYPEQMLAQIKKGLKKGGRLAVVEYHKKLGAMEVSPEFALTHIRAGQEQVVREVVSAGYKLVEAVDYDPQKQYIAMFERE